MNTITAIASNKPANASRIFPRKSNLQKKQAHPYPAAGKAAHKQEITISFLLGFTLSLPFFTGDAGS